MINAAVVQEKRHFIHRENVAVQWASKLCEDKIAAQLIHTQIQEVIITLENNGSYDRVLDKFAQSIAYIKNNSNEDLFFSNCLAYYNGLNNARKDDRKAEELQEQYEEHANSLLRQILFPIIGSFGFNFLT